MKYARKSNKTTKAYRRKRSAVARVKKAQRATQCATIHETLDIEDLKQGIAYEALLRLTQFPRATDLADSFQEYRITKMVWTYTPLFDTFQDASGGASVPYLYTRRQVYPAPDTFDKAYLEAMGAKPRRLDDKSITITYTPNVTIFAGTSIYSQTTPPSVLSGLKPSFKPWMTTYQNNPLSAGAPPFIDQTPHYGHSFWIDQYNANAADTLACRLKVTAYFEFRKPWVILPSQIGQQVPNKVTVGVAQN